MPRRGTTARPHGAVGRTPRAVGRTDPAPAGVPRGPPLPGDRTTTGAARAKPKTARGPSRATPALRSDGGPTRVPEGPPSRCDAPALSRTPRPRTVRRSADTPRAARGSSRTDRTTRRARRNPTAGTGGPPGRVRARRHRGGRARKSVAPPPPVRGLHTGREHAAWSFEVRWAHGAPLHRETNERLRLPTRDRVRRPDPNEPARPAAGPRARRAPSAAAVVPTRPFERSARAAGGLLSAPHRTARARRLRTARPPPIARAGSGAAGTAGRRRPPTPEGSRGSSVR